jgi:hypothetical protein
LRPLTSALSHLVEEAADGQVDGSTGYRAINGSQSDGTAGWLAVAGIEQNAAAPGQTGPSSRR